MCTSPSGMGTCVFPAALHQLSFAALTSGVALISFYGCFLFPMGLLPPLNPRDMGKNIPIPLQAAWHWVLRRKYHSHCHNGSAFCYTPRAPPESQLFSSQQLPDVTPIPTEGRLVRCEAYSRNPQLPRGFGSESIDCLPREEKERARQLVIRNRGSFDDLV